MRKPSSGLNARQVQTVKAAGLYGDGGGLYLQVGPSGAKSWILRFQLAGRRRDNPARWRGHIEKLLPKPASAKRAARRATGRTEHLAALPYPEIGAFVAKLREQGGVGARALQFAIVTAARTGEVIGARWS